MIIIKTQKRNKILQAISFYVQKVRFMYNINRTLIQVDIAHPSLGSKYALFCPTMAYAPLPAELFTAGSSFGVEGGTRTKSSSK